jgi:hypothetical protein
MGDGQAQGSDDRETVLDFARMITGEAALQRQCRLHPVVDQMENVSHGTLSGEKKPAAHRAGFSTFGCQYHPSQRDYRSVCLYQQHLINSSRGRWIFLCGHLKLVKFIAHELEAIAAIVHVADPGCGFELDGPVAAGAIGQFKHLFLS